MEKSEELFVEHTRDIIKKLNSCSMLPFVGKEKVLMMFVEYSNAISDTYRKSVEENDQKVLFRLAELDKLYEEREQERLETFVRVIEDMKGEMIKMARIAFCRGVCKHFTAIRDTTLCYCARRQNFLKSLDEDFNKYMEVNKERIINKYKEVSWKKEK